MAVSPPCERATGPSAISKPLPASVDLIYQKDSPDPLRSHLRLADTYVQLAKAAADPVPWGLRSPEGTAAIRQHYLSDRKQPKVQTAARGQEMEVKVLRTDGMD